MPGTAHTGDWPDGFRQVASPLTRALLKPLPEYLGRVQIDEPLADADYPKVARLLEKHPGIALRVYGDYERKFKDLEFLRHFPRLRRFWVDLWHVPDYSGLAHLPANLLALNLGQTKKALSLDLLAPFTRLRELTIVGHKKGFEVVPTLRDLRSLSVVGAPIMNLAPLRPLTKLTSLWLRAGRLTDLADLPHFDSLRTLDLTLLKDVHDLSPVAAMRDLRELSLGGLPKIAALPNLKDCRALRTVRLGSMTNLTDLSGLAAAPALKELEFTAPHLTADAFRPLVGHPTLRTIRVQLGTNAKNDALDALVRPRKR